MAGDWIKMRWALSTDPGVMQLCNILELDEFAVIGRLHRLWSWADQHSTDGKLSGVSSVTLDRYMLTPNFCAALCAVGWGADEPDGFRLLKFEVHNGNSAKKRALQSKRVKRFRNAGALPEKRREEKRLLSPNGDNNSGGVAAPEPIVGDPWSKPKRVYADPPREPAAASADPATFGAVVAMLERFGFAKSNAFNHAKKPGATPERVKWLVEEAQRRLEARQIDRDKAMGFVVAGIRDRLEPDPGPAVESVEDRIGRAMREREELIAKSKAGAA